MADFSNIGLTNVDWDMTSTLTISEPYINSVTIPTGTTYNAANAILTLPRVTSTIIEDNFTHGHTIVIRDEAGILLSNQISIEPDARDTGVTVNGIAKVQLSTTSGI